MKFSIWIAFAIFVMILHCSCSEPISTSIAAGDERPKIFVPQQHLAFAHLSTAQLRIFDKKSYSDPNFLKRLESWIADGLKNCPQSELKLTGTKTDPIDDYHSVYHCAALCIAGWTALKEEGKLNTLLSFYCKGSDEATKLLREVEMHTRLVPSYLEGKFTLCDSHF